MLSIVKRSLFASGFPLSRSSARDIALALMEVDWERAASKQQHGIEKSRKLLHKLSNELAKAASTFASLSDYPYAQLAMDRMIQKVYGTRSYLRAHDSAIENLNNRLSDLETLMELTEIAAKIEITDWGDLRPARAHAPHQEKKTAAIENLLTAIDRSCAELDELPNSNSAVYDAGQQLLEEIGCEMDMKTMRNRFPLSTFSKG
jgi:hypothetical protein